MLDNPRDRYAELQERFGYIPMNHVAPQFFPVKEGSIYDNRGDVIPGHKRVFREDSGDTLGIHTESYSMVPYERHFQMFERAIADSSLADEECLIGTDMSGNGARIFRQYLFPNIKRTIPARTDREIALRIVMFDSYDGSTAFTGKSGYFDFACANTSFFGLTLGDVKFKHVGNMDEKITVAAERLTTAAVGFINEAERCAAWTGVIMWPDDVDALVSKLPQANKALTDHIVATWAKQDDRTLWGVHQALTAWSSHGVPMRTACDRAKRVTALVEGRDWKVLEPQQ